MKSLFFLMLPILEACSIFSSSESPKDVVALAHSKPPYPYEAPSHVLKDSLLKAPKDERTLFSLALKYYSENKFTLSALYLEKSIGEVNPQLIKNDHAVKSQRLLRALLDLQTGKMTEGRKELCALIEEDPQNEIAHVLLARHYIEQESFDAARFILDEWLLRKPGSHIAELLYGVLERKAQNLPAAQRWLRLANEMNEDPQMRLEVGLHDLLSYDYVLAETRLKEALEIAPTDPRFKLAIGLFYLLSAKKVEAKLVFENLIDENPENPEARYYLAYLEPTKRRAHLEDLLKNERTSPRLRQLAVDGLLGASE